ncbi:MAG: hypothetical protein J5737_06855 [Bacteroidales bacterium]|nr:hypothetical protein [Bacteroidales bacterium]
MKSFNELERQCLCSFEQAGPYWHLWTPEDHPIVFPDELAFMAGMNILALCAKMFPDVTIITFQLMTNHLHLTVAGPREAIEGMMARFIKSLFKYLRTRGLLLDRARFRPSVRQITSLQDLRNVIIYNNRNGYVVSPDETPMSYRWGANSCFFNPSVKERFRESRSTLSVREKRLYARTHDADGITDIITIDGYASPLSFCAIAFGERLFRCASHYFRELSRNIESQKAIAEEIGEKIFYADDELFSVLTGLSKKKYGQMSVALLPAQAKQELANILHYDYNAGNKQIIRMLKLDPRIVASLFPERY